MAPERAAAYIGGGILLAAWLASAAGVTPQPQANRVPRSTPETVHLDALASEVQSQAMRLRQRLATAPAPQAPLRNPFVFAARHTPIRVPAARPPVSEPPAAALPQEVSEPDLVLLGVAVEGETRTAMIAAGEELLMVGVDQPIGGRYRVSAIGADTVELKDFVTGVTRRLRLKLPASPP
jgi:hypothetical protein